MDDDSQTARLAANSAERLEAALARIARQADAPDPVATEIAARLDSLIAQLRSALEE